MGWVFALGSSFSSKISSVFFNDPRWYLRQDAFVCIIQIDIGFLERRLHPKSKSFYGFFVFCKVLLVFGVEDAVISWVEWAKF